MVGERERARVLAALAAVDAVVVFGEADAAGTDRGRAARRDRQGRRLQRGHGGRREGSYVLGRAGEDRANGGRLLNNGADRERRRASSRIRKRLNTDLHG